MSWDAYATAETSWEAARWGSEGSQRLRMNKALELAAPEGGEWLLDWGCGTGRLVEFLRGAGVRYTGADTSPAMISRASADHPSHEFLHLASPSSLIATRPDVVIALGTWNLVEDSFSMPHDLLVLWQKTRRCLVASFHVSDGFDNVHAEHSPHGILGLALMCEAPIWTVERWKPNDVMLTMRREPT